VPKEDTREREGRKINNRVEGGEIQVSAREGKVSSGGVLEI